MSNTPSVADVLARLAQALGAESETALAEKLGVPRSTLGSWKSRGSIPYAECVTVAERNGLSLDWLLLGRYPERGEPAEFANVCKLPGDAEESKNENVFVFDAEADRLLICLQALDEVLGREGAMTPDERRAWARGAYHAIGKELPARADLVDWQRFARQLARVTAAMARKE